MATKLDKYLAKMCKQRKRDRLMFDFLCCFDGGVKKLPRVHQISGVKAAAGNTLQSARAGSLAHFKGPQKHR